MRAHKGPASPLPPSAEGRITRLAAVHVKASCDLNSLLARAGLSSKDIEDARARIGVQNQISFLELASEAIGDPLLGFHLAETFDPRELGLLYYVQASSVTLGEALGCMARYISVAHGGLDASCVDRDGLKVRISYVGVPRHADRQQMEALVTAVIRIGRQLTGHRLRPIRIALAHPRSAASAAFETFLGLPIEFGAEADEISFSAAAGNLPVASADPYLNKSLVSYWETALSRRSSRQNSIRAAVENAILPLLPHGKARIGKVAEDLGVSSRTLSRRLATEGVTYAQVFDEMRADLAEGYLSDRSFRSLTLLGSWVSRKRAPSRTPTSAGQASRQRIADARARVVLPLKSAQRLLPNNRRKETSPTGCGVHATITRAASSVSITGVVRVRSELLSLRGLFRNRKGQRGTSVHGARARGVFD